MPTGPFVNPGRDSQLAVGRFKAADGTVYYTVPGWVVTGTGTSNGSLNTVLYWPLLVRSPIVIDQLALEVTTLGSGNNVRVGTYRADQDYQPVGGPLIDSGNISTTTTGVKTFSPSTPVTLQPGRYLSAFNVDNATPAFRKIVGTVTDPMIRDTFTSSPLPAFLSASQTFGAFPTPGTTWTGSTFVTGVYETYFLYRIKR